MERTLRLACVIVLTVLGMWGTSDAARAALVAGAFNAARAGDASVPSGYLAADIQSAILNHVPDSSIVGTETLNAGFFSSVNFVVLCSAWNRGTPIARLTSTEQSALRDFVLGGGNAILLMDAYFPQASQDFLDPFGMTIGNYTPQTLGTITNTIHPVTNGPNGLASPYLTYVSGGFSLLGPYATSLGELGGGSGIAVIERGAISPGSGRVVLFSDAGAFETGYYFNWNRTLFLNALDYVTSDIQAVPEPSTMTLMLLGMVGLVVARSARTRRRTCVA